MPKIKLPLFGFWSGCGLIFFSSNVLLSLCAVSACSSPSLHQLEETAKAGDGSSQIKLAKMFEAGESLPKDEKMAVYWYTKAAENGDPGAQRKMGLLCANGSGIAKDDKRAVVWFSKAAEKNDGVAQANLGMAYLNGVGTAPDPKMAMHWLEKAAGQGIAAAQAKLGDIYARGIGVSRDDRKAANWYIDAARGGDLEAIKSLGKLYADHHCHRSAFICYKKLADHDLAEGELLLGIAYDRGEGTSRDYGEALKLFNQAADKGSVGAMKYAAEYYLNGYGVSPNKQLAVNWIKKAADMGDEHSKRWLLEHKTDAQ